MSVAQPLPPSGTDVKSIAAQLPHLRYVNEFLRWGCVLDLMEMKLFPNAKEISESVAMYRCVRKHVTPDVRVLHQGGCDEMSSEDGLPPRRDAIIVVGDGVSPRTAAVFAFMSRGWDCYSVDPILRTGEKVAWSSVQRLHPLACKIEQVKFRVRRAIVVMLHAHVSIETTMRSIDCAELTGLVVCPCCNYDVVQSDLHGLAPCVDFEDMGILSVHRRVKVWRHGESSGPGSTPVRPSGPSFAPPMATTAMDADRSARKAGRRRAKGEPRTTAARILAVENKGDVLARVDRSRQRTAFVSDGVARWAALLHKLGLDEDAPGLLSGALPREGLLALPTGSDGGGGGGSNAGGGGTSGGNLCKKEGQVPSELRVVGASPAVVLRSFRDRLEGEVSPQLLCLEDPAAGTPSAEGARASGGSEASVARQFQKARNPLSPVAVPLRRPWLLVRGVVASMRVFGRSLTFAFLRPEEVPEEEGLQPASASAGRRWKEDPRDLLEVYICRDLLAGEAAKVAANLKRGDVLGVYGDLGYTLTGVLAVIAHELCILRRRELIEEKIVKVGYGDQDVL